MQKKKWAMASLGLGIALAVIITFYTNQNSDAVNLSRSIKYRHIEKVKLSATDKKTDMVCAILIMPKTYLPLLEKFKHSKFAREIKIVPAKIGWENDQMIALPKTAIQKSNGHRMQDLNNIFSRKRTLAGKLKGEETNLIRGTMALLFLKGVADSLPNGKLGRKFTSDDNY